MTANVGLPVLLAALAAWEVLAGFVNRGPFARLTTLSEYVWALELRYGWPARAGVATLLVLLACHLIAAWPLGPPS